MELFDGRYEKLEHLGSGTFAEVWKVRDTETDVIEALKIYTSRAGIDNDSVKLFTHEFSLLANANHPNLVKPLHFAISQPDGYPYLRMKYCNNGSMKRQIGKLTEHETWNLIRDIASALAYLHQMNPPVIHQDIKPENILKDGDKYMLSDFGVSTRVKSSLSRFSVMTDTLKKAGTTDYMAPERFSENKTPVMSNDIWSLGATIYELLTMELPFVMGGLTQAHGEKVPILQGSYSSALKQVIRDCMVLEPWKRPRAEQLVEVAQKMVNNQPLPEPLPWKEIKSKEVETTPILVKENDDLEQPKLPNATAPLTMPVSKSVTFQQDYEEELPIKQDYIKSSSLHRQKNSSLALLIAVTSVVGLVLGILLAVLT